ncbi:MAG TPA: di-heme oxidoredictase family protein [Saprospiraceae bacterium]|nr:di-heme oxidoredictase family protein [Saprospiraceae bacterium]HMQ84394.1 di-heme oxidoredictase family protein [Saprospiraceae bacterium]
MKEKVFWLLTAWVLAATQWSCQKDNMGLAEVVAEEELSGGVNFTTFDFSENAFGVQGKKLNSTESGQFVVGNSLFRTNWVTAPASVQSLDGLGPVMNAISCGSCHFKDGRAKPPSTPDETLNGLLFRLSIPIMGENGQLLPDPNYGGQFQDKSILNVLNEGLVRVSYEPITGSYEDGSSFTLRKPVYEFHDLGYGDLHADVLISPRIAPQMPGLGLLENVTEADILARADENDQDGDGISGRPNYVWDASAQQSRLGRFGWKANQPSLLQQTAGAFNGDIGITSSIFPQDHLTDIQRQLYPEVPNGGMPELSDEQLAKVTLYIQALAVPARRDFDEEEVRRGKWLFTELKCAACHVPQMQTSQQSPIESLNNQTIFPYTDLLLHDMGEGLSDGRPDFLATGNEWRTPPLWGIGLVKTVNNHTFFLHDGRASNLEEAILWHGGEAENAQKGFKKLSKSDRDALIAFLESL